MFDVVSFQGQQLAKGCRNGHKHIGLKAPTGSQMPQQIPFTSLDRILCFRFSLISLRFSLKRETDRQKSWAILQNFNSWMIKVTKTPILLNCQVPNVYFCISLQDIYNCSAFSSTYFCQFLSWEEIWEGLRETLRHKIRTSAANRIAKHSSNHWLLSKKSLSFVLRSSMKLASVAKACWK